MEPPPTHPDPGEPVEFYRAGSLPEAHALRLLLEAEGIEPWVDNELLQAALGDLPLGWATAPRIYVARRDEAAARAVLERFLARGRAGGPEPEPPVPTPAPPSPDAVPTTAPAGAASEVPGSPPLSSRMLWFEVAAVLAVAVVPNIASAAYVLVAPRPPGPYWAEALYGIALSGCAVLATLYVIRRSGEAWGRFGITRPGTADVLLGLGLLVLGEFVKTLINRWLPAAGWSDLVGLGARPAALLDPWLAVLRDGANGLAEELVCRAYLITRLEVLLRSRGSAVLTSSVLFASYHVYQGANGVAVALAFGLAYGTAYLLVRSVWPLAVGHALCNLRLEFGT